MEKGRGRCDVVPQATSREDYGDYLRQVFQQAISDFAQRNGRMPKLDCINFRGGITSLSVLIEIEEVD